MKILLDTPPRTLEIARKYFEYLTERAGDFSGDDWNILRDARIIPTLSPNNDSKPQEGHTLVMVKPGECIFKTDADAIFSNLHSEFFVVVDFGLKGNKFLKACGVKSELDIEDIVTLMLKDSKGFLRGMNGEKGYLEQLRRIATYKGFGSDIISRMRTSPFLFGRRKITNLSSESGFGDNFGYDWTFELLKPNEVAIVDDIKTHVLFADSVYAAPDEEVLVNFYSTLGSPRLTTLIKDNCVAYRIESFESEMASKARNLIVERFPLLLHERNISTRCSPAWLAARDNFAVRVCQRLRLNRVLTLHKSISSISEDVSANALMTHWEEKKRLILLLRRCDEPDMYEIADVICKALLINYRPKDSLLFMTMLSTNLGALRRMGYNDDTKVHKIQNERKHKVSKAIHVAKKAVTQQDSGAMSLTQSSDSYCGITASTEYSEVKGVRGKIEKLKRAFTFFSQKLILAIGSSYHAHTLPTSKRDVIERFVSAILNPLGTVFNLPVTSLNMVYDLRRALVSFNKGGDIFLNIKPYEDWHDAEVIEGRTEKTLISWYHSIAHQLAVRHAYR
ncbi:hypothetical protein FRC02_007724 [Tulasnella sp. 418]|nr:hypothetical protein FRC02_007724 [Tulasnella sp. 418]